MILHDTCSIKITEYVDQLSGATPRVIDLGQVPCEITPLNSVAASDAGPIVTRYTFFTATDVVQAVDDAPWIVDSIEITYRGKTLQPEAGFEVHRVLGRFHHIEAIVKDFGSIGV